MKALISDIHGNLEALQAVLQDIALHTVEAIYCFDDLVGYGSEMTAACSCKGPVGVGSLCGGTTAECPAFLSKAYRRVIGNVTVSAAAESGRSMNRT